MKIYRDDDVDMKILEGKRISFLGYGSQGRAQALCFRDSGLDVKVAVRKGGSFDNAVRDGFAVTDIPDAVRNSDIVMMMLPDEAQADIYREEVGPYLRKGMTLEFAHGFSIVFGLIKPPKDIDVIMMAPKGPGPMIRRVYESGSGVPAIVSVHQEYSGHAFETALALAKAMGCTRPGVFETTFRNETVTDLFGEQAVLCGGYTAMITAAFETLVGRGYPPEMAYFEVLHETKLVTDLVNERGIEGMWKAVSNTAEYGGLTRRDRVITEESRKGMGSILDDIESGRFADEWIQEYHNGLTHMREMQQNDGKHQAETTGRMIRKEFFGRDARMSTIRIVTRNASFNARLDSSDISNEIWLGLPFRGEINMFGGEIYFECPVTCPIPDRRSTVFEKGDIAYWPEAEALCIFFGPTPYSGGDMRPVSKFPLVGIGSVIGDCSSLEGAGDRSRILIEKDFIRS